MTDSRIDASTAARRRAGLLAGAVVVGWTLLLMTVSGAPFIVRVIVEGQAELVAPFVGSSLVQFLLNGAPFALGVALGFAFLPTSPEPTIPAAVKRSVLATAIGIGAAIIVAVAVGVGVAVVRAGWSGPIAPYLARSNPIDAVVGAFVFGISLLPVVLLIGIALVWRDRPAASVDAP